MQNEPKYPNRLDVELPLLRILADVGGSIVFSTHGKRVEETLAERMGLSEAHCTFIDENNHAKDHRKWRNEIQFVRNALADKLELHRVVEDLWEVSLQGYKRLGVEPHEGATAATPNKVDAYLAKLGL